ncbi:MAG: hypothetical protein ACTHNT_07330 [Actinomycetales bacterium]
MTTMPGPQRGKLRGREWHRISWGLYRASAANGLVPDLEAWQLVLPEDGAFTHLTAAALAGWWLPPLPTDAPVFTCIPHAAARPRRSGLHVVRRGQPFEVRRRDSLRVTTPADTLLACARDLGVLDLVVLLDSALHAGACTLEDLESAASRRQRGSPRLREAIPLADARSESAWESVLRMFHATCHVPVEPQRELRDDLGGFVARADLWLVGTSTVHEYDGAHHRDGQQHRADLARERRLVNAGFTRRGYTSTDLLHRPAGVLRDADQSLGRPHDPRRVRAWHRLLTGSLFTAGGREAMRLRWGVAS